MNHGAVSGNRLAEKRGGHHAERRPRCRGPKPLQGCLVDEEDNGSQAAFPALHDLIHGNVVEAARIHGAYPVPDEGGQLLLGDRRHIETFDLAIKAGKKHDVDAVRPMVKLFPAGVSENNLFTSQLAERNTRCHGRFPNSEKMGMMKVNTRYIMIAPTRMISAGSIRFMNRVVHFSSSVW